MTESILQWNLRGFYEHLEGIKRLVAVYRPMGLCLQETKLRPGHSAHLAGYSWFGKEIQPGPGGRAHGGVAILIRNNIKADQVPLNTNLQAIAVRVKGPIQVTLISVYLPDAHWCKTHLEDLLQQLPQPILLLGDFNSHNIWWGSQRTDPQGRALEDVIDNTNLALLNNGAPTHFNAYAGTFSVIDLSFASPSIATRLEWAPAEELFHSDHYPLIIASRISRTDYVIPVRYNLRKANWSRFSASFMAPTQTGRIDEDVRNLTNEILRAADEAIPKKGGVVLRPPVPWWTSKCKLLNREKKKALCRFKRNATPENLEYFRRCRAKEKYTIKNAKRCTLKAFISGISTSADPKDIWNRIKSFSHGRQCSIMPALQAGDNTFNRPEEVVRVLAEYYAQASSSAQYSDSFLQHKNDLERCNLNFDSADLESYNTPLTSKELDNVLLKTKNSAPGGDGIPYFVLRELPMAGKKCLLEIFNSIWLTGKYPSFWREAIILPIRKEGKDPSAPSSYRPISLTSCLSKILEAMVNERLVYILETRGLYNRHQAGFRRFHSTLDQLSYLETYIQDAFIRKDHVIAVFFDLEKAFDTTWKFGILRKLYDWGFRGRLPRFLQSFLEHRSFRVRIGSHQSERYTQENGIPQGSVLSVTLFAVAVNSVTDRVQDPVRKSLYVDDLSLFVSGKDITDMGHILQAAIDEVNTAAKMSGFKFSTSKSVCMHFCRLRTEHTAPTLYLNGIPLEYKESVRFLGLRVDRTLSWKDHIEETAIKCKKSLNILKFLAAFRWNLEREILMRVFYCIVRSKLEYGAPVYSSARKSRLLVLDRVYNLGLRIVTGAFRTSPLESLYVEAGVLPPALRREQLLLTYAAGAWGKLEHFVYPILFGDSDYALYHRHVTRTRPINVRLADLMEAEGIVFGPVLERTSLQTPPWLIPPAKVLTELAIYNKDSTLPNVYREKFISILEQYETHQRIYTDGSKISNGVGCAVHSLGNTYKWTLPPFSSVYTAELYSIHKALELCITSKNRRFIICSDSLSAITALKSNFSSDPLVHKIYEQLVELKHSDKDVVFVWIPSHIGIPGNERADEGAKLAASGSPEVDLQVRPDDVKYLCKCTIMEKWQRRWCLLNEKLREVKPDVRGTTKESVGRRERVILTRLRIGHTRITHTYLLVGARPRRCSFCPERLTVKHMFEGCRALLIHKTSVGLQGTTKDILNDANQIDKIFRYLIRINMFYKI